MSEIKKCPFIYSIILTQKVKDVTLQFEKMGNTKSLLKYTDFIAFQNLYQGYKCSHLLLVDDAKPGYRNLVTCVSYNDTDHKPLYLMTTKSSYQIPTISRVGYVPHIYSQARPTRLGSKLLNSMKICGSQGQSTTGQNFTCHPTYDNVAANFSSSCENLQNR